MTDVSIAGLGEAPQAVLIVGASVRAAVQSLQRAGIRRVIAADLFQDRDLGLAARCRLTPGYQELPYEVSRWQPDAWLYTGALENHPQRVAEVAIAPLGNSPDVLRAVRDPWNVAATLQGAGLPTLALARRSRGLPRNGGWLQKRLASAGGRNVVVVDHSFLETSDPSVYFQQRARGSSVAGVFVANGEACCLLGVTRQWVGVGDPRAGRFQYLGSSGPLPLSAALRDQWRRLGDALVRRFALRGLFGVDAVLEKDRVWLVEVNPRYTASVEVLERTARWNAWQVHWQACRAGHLPARDVLTSTGVAAKRILFAPVDMDVSERMLTWAEAQNVARPWPVLADLPATAGWVSRGSPLLTILAGPTPTYALQAVEAEISNRWQQVLRTLTLAPHSGVIDP